MKRYLLLIALTMCFFLNSKAQRNNEKIITPKEDIKVNREYDEKGNLIKFDSVYSYSWSGDSTLMKSISPENLLELFGKHFGNLPDSAFFGDSFFGEFDPFFGSFDGKQDSMKFDGSQIGSMNDLLKMLQDQMEQMEEYQRNILKEQPKFKEF